MHSFDMIQFRINDPMVRQQNWGIKSTLYKESTVPLMHKNPSDLKSLGDLPYKKDESAYHTFSG